MLMIIRGKKEEVDEIFGFIDEIYKYLVRCHEIAWMDFLGRAQ